MNIIPAFIRRHIVNKPTLLRIVDNISWLAMDKIMRMCMGLVVGVFVARHLGPEMFGALSFALAFVGLFTPIAGLGLKDIVVRDLVKEQEATSSILGTSGVLRILSGLVTYVIIVGAILLLRPDDGLAKSMVMVIGLIVIMQTSEIAAFQFEAQVRSKYTVFAQGAAFTVFTLVRIALLTADAPVIAFAIATSAEAALAAFLLLILFLRKGNAPPSMAVNADRARKLMTDSWPLLLTGVAIMFNVRIDQVMIGQMLDSTAVGTYSVAVRINEFWYFIPMIISASVFPALVVTWQHSKQEYYSRLQSLFNLLTWVAICIAVSMTVLATPLVSAVFGNAYLEAASIIVIHTWTGVFVALGVASSQWYVLENRQVLSLHRAVLGAAVNIGLNLLLIPRLGILGAAWATLISQVVATLLADLLSWETRHLFRMKLLTLWPRINRS